MFFRVETVWLGETYYLRKTIWTASKDRADQYATEEVAKAAIVKAAKFNPRPAKKAQVVPIT